MSKTRSKPASTSWFSSSLDALQLARAKRAATNVPTVPIATQKPASISHQQARQTSTLTLRGLTSQQTSITSTLDSTGFEYDVTLTRIDLANNRNERYHLRLYESHTQRVHTAPISVSQNLLSYPRRSCCTFGELLFDCLPEFLQCVPQEDSAALGMSGFERGLAMVRKLPGRSRTYILPPPAGDPRGVLPETKLAKVNGDKEVCEDSI